MIILSLSSWVIAVDSPLSGLALSSGRGLVHLTAVHTSAPLASSRKLFQHAIFAYRMALRRSRRVPLLALHLLSRWARLALPSAFLSSDISSVHQRLDRMQTLRGLVNSFRMPAIVSRIHFTSSSIPPAGGPLLLAAPSNHFLASARTSFSALAPPGFHPCAWSHPVVIL